MAALSNGAQRSGYYVPTPEEIAIHGTEKLNVMYEGVPDLLRATADGNLERAKICVSKIEQGYALHGRHAWFLWMTDALTTAAQFNREEVAAFLLEENGGGCGSLCPQGKCEEAFAAAATAGGS